MKLCKQSVGVTTNILFSTGRIFPRSRNWRDSIWARRGADAPSIGDNRKWPVLSPQMAPMKQDYDESPSEGPQAIPVITPSGCDIVYDSWKDHCRWNPISFSYMKWWQKDNPDIRHQYRPQLHSYSLCLLSIFRIHTETINIWTHLLGMLMVIGIMVTMLIKLDGDHIDKGMISVFCITAFICFFNSSMFHTFLCHSASVKSFWNRMDYVSIIVLIVGSFVAWLYFMFGCWPKIRIVYMCIIAALGITMIVMFTFNRFTHPQYRHFRAGCFIGLGLCGIAPALHLLYTIGFDYAIHKRSMGWLVGLGCSYIIGACIYAVRIPERWLPGHFDILFHSHQFLHISTLVGVSLNAYGLHKMAKFQLTEESCLPGL